MPWINRDNELICPMCGNEFIIDNILCIGETCPNCGKAALVYIEDVYPFGDYTDEKLIQEHENLHNLFEKIEEDGTKDLSKPYYKDSLPTYINCNPKEENEFLEQTPTLSFHDLECNEMALMDMVDIAFQEEIDAPEIFGDNCITQMNERFLHTFIDDCF